MRVAVAGSIATDHLMRFPGRFTDSLLPDQLDHISLSFLVDELDIRRGGVGANVAFGMGCLGLRPVLLGAVGADFEDYRSWLDRHGVDTTWIRQSDTLHTARFVCTTDIDRNQIASFYPGAMSEARLIELGPIVDRAGGIDLVVISPDDPQAMRRHTQECRLRGIAFVADPSQQLTSMDGDDIEALVNGAAYLFANEYESGLIRQRTGWTSEQICRRVGVQVTTLGPEGALVETIDGEVCRVAVPQERRRADPTGVGDGFRAGFLAARSWGLGYERCAQVGCLLATYVLETVGTQEYEFTSDDFTHRFAQAYGVAAAQELTPHLPVAA